MPLLVQILTELQQIRLLLQEKRSPTPTDLLLPEELCQRLKISRSTLHNYRQQALPHFKIGNRTYYSWTEVLAHLRQSTAKQTP